MSKLLTYGKDARAQLLVGAETLSRYVGATLGPKGRNICIEHRVVPPTGMNAPIQKWSHVTKDGVSVAREIEMSDPVENMGVELVRQAATQTVREAGDGTTTATILAHAIYAGGLAHVDAGANPIHVKRGIEKAVEAVLSNLDAQTVHLSGDSRAAMLSQIATISANGDESIASVVTSAIESAGPDGVVSIDYSKTVDTHIEVSKGMRIDSGMVVENFVTNPERGECVLTDCYILLHQRSLKSFQPLVPLIEYVIKANGSLLVLSESFENEFLQFLVANKMNGALRSCAVRLPFHGDLAKEVLPDLAALTGGKAFTDETAIKLDSIIPEQLGRAARVVITKNTCTIMDGAGKPEAIEARADQIRADLKSTESEMRRNYLQSRLAKLVGGIAVIRVGAPTPTECQEKKDRVEDAMFAVRAAIEQGVVAGGGAALVHASRALPVSAADSSDELKGYSIIRDACEEPACRIQENGGYKVEWLAETPGVSFGFNALTGEWGNLIEQGVIDPVKVVKSALSNAASVAATMLMIEGTITHPNEQKEKL